VSSSTIDLPHNEHRYYIFKTVLPKGAVLKSLTYTEKVN